jgi:hypothetical protein
MSSVNEFVFAGTIGEVDDPLLSNDGKRVLGHSAEVQQMGVSLRLWLPSNAFSDPRPGDEVTVSGKLVPASSGWPKVKTTGVIVGKRGPETPAESGKKAAAAA